MYMFLIYSKETTDPPRCTCGADNDRGAAASRARFSAESRRLRGRQQIPAQVLRVSEAPVLQDRQPGRLQLL